MKNQKHIPLRMCAICRQRFPKRSLIRFVKADDGQAILDETGKMQGRGFYVCRSADCLAQAQKGARLEKAAGARISEELITQLKDKVENGP